jgi:hypothetical protein
MSLTEIKEEMTRLSADERAELAAHLAMLEKIGSAGWQQEIARRLEESKADRHTTLDELTAGNRVAEEP